MKKPTVHIIGGDGKMGQWLKHFLESRKISVTVSDKNYRSKISVITAADIVVVSVPISAVEHVIRDIAPHLRREQLLTDLTSVKVMPMRAMRHAKCATLGMHPMFGPGAPSLRGQKLVFCRQKNNQNVEFLKRLFRQAGIRVIEMSPQEHDQEAAYVQGLTHAFYQSFAKILADRKGKPLKLTTPIFVAHMATLKRVMSQDPKLVKDIQQYNPYFKKLCQKIYKEI